jgi:hypothetical protein
MTHTLGLDISTSIVGICIFKDDDFLLMDKIDLTKTKEFFEKASIVKTRITDICNTYNITNIFIEDILQSFQRGLSSAKTISQLARFNGIVSYISFEISGLIPVYLNVNSCRKTLNIKIDKNSSKSTKEQIIDWVGNDLGGYAWPTKILSRGKNKGNIVFEKYVPDMADAYVVCKSGLKIV